MNGKTVNAQAWVTYPSLEPREGEQLINLEEKREEGTVFSPTAVSGKGFPGTLRQLSIAV